MSKLQCRAERRGIGATQAALRSAGQARYVFSGERVPLACRFRRLAENLVPHFSFWEERKLEKRESGGPPNSARGPRALPGVPGGTLNRYEPGFRIHGLLYCTYDQRVIQLDRKSVV